MHLTGVRCDPLLTSAALIHRSLNVPRVSQSIGWLLAAAAAAVVVVVVGPIFLLAWPSELCGHLVLTSQQPSIGIVSSASQDRWRILVTAIFGTSALFVSSTTGELAQQ